MKKFLSIILALVFVFSITGCGNSTKGANYEYSMSEAQQYDSAEIESPKAEDGSMKIGIAAEEPSNHQNNENVPIDDRKIIKYNNLNLQTKDFDTALSQILATIKDSGGYIEFNETSGRNLYNDGRTERSATIRARIPVEKLDETTLKMGEICNIQSQNSKIQDITDSYFDTDARLKSMTAQEKRLLELLEVAQSMEDIIQIEQKLSEIRFEIERLTATIKRMDGQISYSYLNIDLQEVIEYDEVQETFGNRVSASLNRSGRNIIRWGEDVIFFIIEQLPIILLDLLVIGIILLIVLKLNKKYSRFKINRFLKRDKKEYDNIKITKNDDKTLK